MKKRGKPKIVDMTTPKRRRETAKFKAEVDAKQKAFAAFNADCARMEAACDGLERMRIEDEWAGRTFREELRPKLEANANKRREAFAHAELPPALRKRKAKRGGK